ncbi:hypothetical protein NCS52_00734300 [Fusarium sp. LHS14.1]|nr:hypothetical protein NCS52_00734300 [Fusarium sp. LHS14.1]
MLLFLIFAVFMALASAQCPSGAHIVVARGSEEPQGPGVLGPVAERIKNLVPGSDVESLVYPALFEPYNPSQMAGVAAMTQLVGDFTHQCPNTKVIILGYSQGAHVTLDTFCGPSSAGFPETAPPPASFANKVAAIIVMGDPSLVESQPFTVGSSDGSGVLARQNPDGCKAIVNKTISICDAGDTFCEAGSQNLTVHMSYATIWGDYIVSRASAMFQSAQG